MYLPKQIALGGRKQFVPFLAFNATLVYIIACHKTRNIPAIVILIVAFLYIHIILSILEGRSKTLGYSAIPGLSLCVLAPNVGL